MGTLYYFGKTDGSRELFALNKVYHYALDGHGGGWADAFDKEAGVRVSDVVGSPEAFATRFVTATQPEWGVRIGRRLFAWAGDVPIRFLSEHNYDVVQGDIDYDEHKNLITGSAHDSDYEADGTTYKRGSAW